jgi:hypothetical protein
VGGAVPNQLIFEKMTPSMQSLKSALYNVVYLYGLKRLFAFLSRHPHAVIMTISFVVSLWSMTDARLAVWPFSVFYQDLYLAYLNAFPDLMNLKPGHGLYVDLGGIATLLLNFSIVVLWLETYLLITRSPRTARFGHVGYLAIMALMGVFVYCGFIGYVKYRGWYYARPFVAHPTQTAVYCGRDGDLKHSLILSDEHRQRAILETNLIMQHNVKYDSNQMVIVTSEKMGLIVQLLKQHGFFEMPQIVGPIYVIDNVIEVLTITDDTTERTVRAMVGEKGFEEFDILAQELSRIVGRKLEFRYSWKRLTP